LYHTRLAKTYSRCAIGGGNRVLLYIKLDWQLAAASSAPGAMSPALEGGAMGCMAIDESSQPWRTLLSANVNATIWGAVAFS